MCGEMDLYFFIVQTFFFLPSDITSSSYIMKHIFHSPSVNVDVLLCSPAHF